MIRKDDEELLARFQRAWVARRGVAAQARAARAEGHIDYLAEAEAFSTAGQEAAYDWLLGGSPVSPQLRLAAAVNDETVIAEYRAADDEFQAGGARLVEREARAGADRFDVDEAYHYAGGVRNALFWALSRPNVLAR